MATANLPAKFEIPLGDTSSLEDDLITSIASKEVTVIVAGRGRAGKSTALNNIFNLDLPAFSSAKSVTQDIECRRTTKDGVTLHIIDTPGLGALDIPKESVLRKINIKGDFILLLCFPVGPGRGWTETDENIIRNLNDVFGSEVWDRCVPLFTYSDLARYNEGQEQGAEEKYKELLESHCQVIENILRQCRINKSLRTIYSYASEEQYRRETLDGMVALPVAKDNKVPTSWILPGLNWARNMKWAEIAFIEIVKKAGKSSMTLARFREGTEFVDYIEKVLKRVKQVMSRASSDIEDRFSEELKIVKQVMSRASSDINDQFGKRAGMVIGVGVGAGVVLAMIAAGLLVTYYKNKK